MSTLRRKSFRNPNVNPEQKVIPGPEFQPCAESHPGIRMSTSSRKSSPIPNVNPAQKVNPDPEWQPCPESHSGSRMSTRTESHPGSRMSTLRRKSFWNPNVNPEQKVNPDTDPPSPNPYMYTPKLPTPCLSTLNQSGGSRVLCQPPNPNP
ncbi:hypothetical protein T484DRAFT_3636209 [Baffinella frigidus]|nr:hypothetical protein T484DRAFT_3636209 [Cryptophyta sp. CCMP2293]